VKLLSGRALPQPCVLTLGKFESIHRGHRALIDKAKSLAAAQGLATAVVAFTPHPYCVVQQEAYCPLFTQAERAHLLADVDYLVEYPFDAALMNMDEAAFADILFHDLQARIVVVGRDFRFGRGRAGTVHSLQQLGEARRSTVYIEENLPGVSTSAIRGYLAQDTPQLAQVEALLGFPYFAMGVVTRGRRLGRQLGFPTLNLYPPGEKFLPKFGVYATRTTLHGQCFAGITNVGLRPTVNADERIPTIETHLLDFNQDAYDATIKVAFTKFIRKEMQFASLEALKEQISQDIHSHLGLSIS